MEAFLPMRKELGIGVRERKPSRRALYILNAGANKK
jgi:hypothetical protein